VPDEARAERVRQAIACDRALPAQLFMVTTMAAAVTTLGEVTL
jgi:hypothetical protein